MAYKWRDEDPAFAEEWALCYEDSTDLAEEEAYRRAVEGFDKPVFYQGERVGEVREYSDRMLELILKGRRREVYGDKVETTFGLSDPLQRLVEEIHQDRRSLRTIEHE